MANPNDFIVQPVNALGAYLGGVQARQGMVEGENRNALLKMQQQSEQQRAALYQQQQAQGASEAEQKKRRAIIEDLAQATDWVQQAQSPEEQAQRWNQVIDAYKPVMGDAVEQYRNPQSIGPVSAWAKSQLKASDTPSSVREYEYWNRLSPSEQERFLNLRRANQIADIGGGKSLVTPSGKTTALSTPEQENAAAAAKAGAVEGAKTAAESTAKAAADLPRIQSTADQMLQQIDALEKHPGLDYLIGGAALAPIVPGTAQADAEAIREQVQGAAFLQAFNQLKGAGQITEAEGAKATNAIARLQRKQSKEGFRKALADLRQVIKQGVMRAESAAKKAPAAATNASELSDDDIKKALGL